MTRVRENERVAREQQARQRTKAESQKAGEEFARVVANKKDTSQSTAKNEARARSASESQLARQNATKQGGTAAQSALMARQGIASHKFADIMQKQGKSSLQSNESQNKKRSSGLKDSEGAANSRQAEADGVRAENRRDVVQEIRREDHKGERQGQDGLAERQLGQKQETQAPKAVVGEANATAPTDGQQPAAQAAAAAAPNRIPPEVMQQLVKRILVGADAEGLSQMHIDFNDGVLGGTSVAITVENGKVGCKFTATDTNTKRLIKASEGELARALEGNGLALDRLDVDQR